MINEVLKETRLVIICIMLLSLCAIGYTLPGCQPAVVEGIINPGEVPASFEAIIAYRTDRAGLTYKWSSDNGMIKGEGKSVIWVAPEIPGKYDISVKIEDAAGKTTEEHANINVVPFAQAAIIVSPDIVLQSSSADNVFISEQLCMVPMTTVVISCATSDTNENKFTYTWSGNVGK
jgi:hypothetical protein